MTDDEAKDAEIAMAEAGYTWLLKAAAETIYSETNHPVYRTVSGERTGDAIQAQHFASKAEAEAKLATLAVEERSSWRVYALNPQ